MGRLLPFLLGFLVLGLSLGRGVRAGEADVTALRARLQTTREPKMADEILDALAERIGKQPGFADAGAFGDWLGGVAVADAVRARVLLRRGWAYLAAKRAGAARSAVEAVVRAGGDDAGVALAYLGEVARQEGDPAQAFDHLRAALDRGYVDAFVFECAEKAAYEMRTATPSKAFEGLPAYVTSLERVLEAPDQPRLRAVVARWLLDDYGAYATPGSERARLWARTAARHALAAAPVQGIGADARLLYDASEALRPEDEETGRTARYDVLAWAYRLGNRPADDTHEIPAAIVDLAELALRDHRYELANRLARQRLQISDSPTARRVLAALPPDLGE